MPRSLSLFLGFRVCFGVIGAGEKVGFGSGVIDLDVSDEITQCAARGKRIESMLVVRIEI